MELRFRPSSALGRSDLFSSFLPPSQELWVVAPPFKKTVCISRLKGQIVPLKLRGLAVSILATTRSQRRLETASSVQQSNDCTAASGTELGVALQVPWPASGFPRRGVRRIFLRSGCPPVAGAMDLSAQTRSVFEIAQRALWQKHCFFGLENDMGGKNSVGRWLLG